MIAAWHIAELLDLVRQRYPDWDDFAHPPFVADEIAPKRRAVSQIEALLNKPTFDALLQQGQHEAIRQHLITLGKRSNQLYNRVPTTGDLNILYSGRLDVVRFAHQTRHLFFGTEPTPSRIDAYVRFAFDNHLGSVKWPFLTYFLANLSPEREIFIKPRPFQWFLKFIGRGDVYSTRPQGAAYATIREAARALQEEMAAYGPQDLIDIQSLIWVGSREAVARTGRLTPRAQVELDVPHTGYERAPAVAFLRDDDPDGTYELTAAVEPRKMEAYTLGQLASETGYETKRLRRWIDAIVKKGQGALTGPPGTGKTYLAQKLAQHLVSDSDGFVELVQFHPTYAYEDFIQGIRPVTVDDRVRYEQVDGRFLTFCARAMGRTGRCVLIIDEMNRANLSRVFGELLFLLEYREQAIKLSSGETFQIPENVILIGTMNSADRSIALVDHAIRRRFAFIELSPDFRILAQFHQRQANGYDPKALIGLLTEINQQIQDPRYALGISYFMRDDLASNLGEVWEMEVEPYLSEYFFDQPQVVARYAWPSIGKRLGWAN